MNRVARPFYGEALRIYEEGIADIPTIDWAMKELGGFRMGPFELMDLIGNDVNYAVTKSVFEAFYYDPRYRPSLTQRRMVEAGRLGRKTGIGYYEYHDGAARPEPITDRALGQQVLDRVVAMLINEAADAVRHRALGEPARLGRAAGRPHRRSDPRELPCDPGPEESGGRPPGADRDRGGEPHLLQPVVEPRARRLEAEDLRGEVREQAQGEEPVGDRGAERPRGGRLDVDVDPLVVERGVGEGVDPGLVDAQPVAGADVGARGRGDLVEGGEGAHAHEHSA
mgnify:CR=1 FL=1